MLSCKSHRKYRHPPPLPFTRVLDRCGRMQYSTKRPPKCEHLGQLKLLVSEIEFLTPYFGQSLRVIYAGAAPGLHVPILAELFSTMHFVLVDPAQSMIADREYCNIEVIRDFMTDELASAYATGPVLFISDVRVGAPDASETDEAQQIRIQRDMDAQRRWVEIMNPLSSILKFRLPWSVGGNTTRYLDGKIHFPVYGKELTHEARLIVSMNAPLKDYDNARYEQKMAYFNRRMRPATYPGGRCYDCTSFHWVVSGYLAAAGYRDTDCSLKCHWIERELDKCKQRWLVSPLRNAQA